jgi:hypothetical protein
LKNRRGGNSAYSRNRQDRRKKTNWIEVKPPEAVFLTLLWSPGIDSKELISPAYALAGLYNNPIPSPHVLKLHNPASTENFFFEFLSDFSVCFPLRPLDMRLERKKILLVPEV